MGTHISTAPSLNGQITPGFSSVSSIAGLIRAKEISNRASSLLRRALTLAIAILQFCVKIVVFGAIVLWPWESAW